ncbi:MAG: tetratricopeptide repeat protein [Candidatus Rokubacteria bacterium]|nr:tetratricopeptide repeat protein [Candidatus Rokubacteria bacterium]
MVFLPALANGFIDWDDGSLLLRNPWYRGLGPSNLAWMFTTVLMGHWMPVNWLSFGLDYLLWGMNPAGYHLTNVLLHAAGVVVFFCVARALLRPALPARPASDPWLSMGALVAALAFGIHPLRVESVAWVTERRDVLSGLFYLLAVWAYLRYIARRAKSAYWAALGCFALALMSKSITASLPGLLVLLDIYPLRRLGGAAGWLTPAARRVWLEKLPFAALAVAGAAVAVRAIAVGGGLTPLGVLGLPARAALSLYALGFYLAKLLWPTSLSPLYELALPVRPLEARIVLSALGVVAVTGAALLLRRRWPAFLAAWAAFALTLLPVLGIAHNGYQAAADRYTYLACLGFAALAGGAVAVWRRRALWPAALGLLALAALTWMQVPVWRSDESLWRRAVELEPGSGVARSNLGAALTAERRYADAVAELERAVALRPGYAEAWNNLGLAWAQQGRPAEAAEGFRRAVAVRPRFAEAWNNLGVALAVQGRRDEALSHFREALRPNPDYAEARNNLGLALAQEGKLREAAEQFMRAVELNPEWIDARRNLEQAQRLLGR